MKSGNAQKMVYYGKYFRQESCQETKMVDIRYQARKLELIASDYTQFLDASAK
jgi:hypothetical protein